MDDPTLWISQYGPIIGLSIFAILGLVQTITKLIPDAWNWWTRHREDIREDQQKLTEAKTKTEQLEKLTAMGSRTFIEDQLTMMSADTQVQLGEANEFIRREIASDIRIIFDLLTHLQDKINRLPTGQDFRELTQRVEFIKDIIEHELGSKKQAK